MDVYTPAHLALEFDARIHLVKKLKINTEGKSVYRFVLIGLFYENRTRLGCNSGNFKNDLSFFQKILNHSRKKNKKVKQAIAKQKRSDFEKKKRAEAKSLRPVIRTEKKKIVATTTELLLFPDLQEEKKIVLKRTKKNSFPDQEREIPQWGTSIKFSSLEEEVKALELNPEIYF